VKQHGLAVRRQRPDGIGLNKQLRGNVRDRLAAVSPNSDQSSYQSAAEAEFNAFRYRPNCFRPFQERFLTIPMVSPLPGLPGLGFC